MARKTKNTPKLLTMDNLDHRTLAFKEAEAKRDAIIDDLGGRENISTLESMQADHAAVTDALATSIEVRLLAGTEIPLKEREAATVLATTLNVFNRIATQLGNARRPREVTPSVEQYLEMKAKVREAEDAATT